VRAYAQVSMKGNLGKDPEIKYNQAGEPIGIFSVAVSEKYKKKNGQEVDETSWFNVTVFGRQAKVVRDYLAKGNQVQIRNAKLKIEEYEGKKYTKVIVDDFNGNIDLLGDKNAAKPESTSPAEPFQATDDDVPF